MKATIALIAGLVGLACGAVALYLVLTEKQPDTIELRGARGHSLMLSGDSVLLLQNGQVRASLAIIGDCGDLFLASTDDTKSFNQCGERLGGAEALGDPR